jgi:hypothetical protein
MTNYRHELRHMKLTLWHFMMGNAFHHAVQLLLCCDQEHFFIRNRFGLSIPGQWVRICLSMRKTIQLLKQKTTTITTPL